MLLSGMKATITYAVPFAKVMPKDCLYWKLFKDHNSTFPLTAERLKDLGYVQVWLKKYTTMQTAVEPILTNTFCTIKKDIWKNTWHAEPSSAKIIADIVIQCLVEPKDRMTSANICENLQV